MNKIYIAIGSNLNNPVYQLKKAIDHLDDHKDFKLIKKSSFYQTKPIGIVNQPDFINAVIEIEYNDTPEKLLNELLRIEKLFGRVRDKKNGPRILDLDILLFNTLVINDNNLSIPHPRMMERIFVLLPLEEIAPNIFINKMPIKKLLSQLSYEGIKKVGN